MRNRAFLASLTLTALLISSMNAYSANTAKPGAICPKAGMAQTVKGIRYTCVKSGKKLVWNKGVVLARPNPSGSASTPTPTPSPTPTPTPIPSPSTTPSPTPTPSQIPSATPTPSPTVPKLSFIEILRSAPIEGKYPISYETYSVPKQLPQSWDDVFENREGISYKAWLSISQAARNSKGALGDVKLVKGPNTSLPFTDIEPAMNLVSKAFTNASQPRMVNIIAFNYQDQLWADDVYRKLIAGESETFKSNHQNYVLDMCSASRKVCWSAMGFTNSNGDGIILLGIVEWEKLRTLDGSYSSFSRSEEGLTIAHEYFHTIQRKIIGQNWFVMEYTPPIWFNEATAVYVENGAMNFNSYDRYMRFRAVDSRFAYPSCGTAANGCIPISYEVMVDFLSLRHYSTNWGNFPYGMKYEVSQRVIEVLVALKGHTAITDVYSYMAENHTFEQAFQHIFGISYSSAIPILARIVSDEFAHNR